ncbi:hypothetical protein QAD02_006571 [Eretmocerus hayati]|uniref:Uncharacterized protein n=1 Tax=Eretmocerus hayati TaxID=131215 RepID=A0ACC2N3L7_9HYME|nr:hypothetical protein QAD02_006571 [Eretmocerus hayati]
MARGSYEKPPKNTCVPFMKATVVIVLTLIIKGTGGDLIIGLRQAGDEEIGSGEARLRGSPDQVIGFAETYPGDNMRLITQLKVEEVSNLDTGGGSNGAHVALIAGGPEHSFVSLAYSIPRRVRATYKVTLYGKLPPFRKIP